MCGVQRRRAAGKLLQKQISDKSEHSACNAVRGALLSHTTTAFTNSEDCCLTSCWYLIWCFLDLISDQSDGKTVLITHKGTTYTAPLSTSAPRSQQWENATNTSELIKVHVFASCRGGSSVTAAEITQRKTTNPLRILCINSAHTQQFNRYLNCLFSLAWLQLCQC